MEMVTERVFKRKKELIKRDPLYHELYKAFQKGKGTGDLLTKVQQKWCVMLRLNYVSGKVEVMGPLNIPEVIWVGAAPRGYSALPGQLAPRARLGRDGSILDPNGNPPLLVWMPYPNPNGYEDSQFVDINEFIPHREEIGEKWLPIIVNVSRLNKADAKIIKKQVWSLIEANLQKGKTKEPCEEHRECSFLYSLRNERTFENYLRWYDLAIGTDYQKPNGFSFRAIAFCEYVLRKHPEKYEDAKEDIAKRTKVVRTARGERVLKGVVGEHIKGEDAVEKGVKVIYNAIHRKPYASKKTKQKEYNCPVHGVSCPSMGCPYLKKWMKDFNKRRMLFKPLYTTDPVVLPQVIGDRRSHSKRKPTADQQSNTDKTLYSA